MLECTSDNFFIEISSEIPILSREAPVHYLAIILEIYASRNIPIDSFKVALFSEIIRSVDQLPIEAYIKLWISLGKL